MGGLSQDWYLTQGVRFVYTAELRNNGFDFILPEEQILPSGQEFWELFKVTKTRALSATNRNLFPIPASPPSTS